MAALAWRNLFRAPLRRLFTAVVIGLNLLAICGTHAALGPTPEDRLAQWGTLIETAREMPEWQQVQIVNRFFNQIRFATDQEQWRQADYWATLAELLSANAGDCEDLSIAKYLTLRKVGVPAERLRLTYVKALVGERRHVQDHMVLSYHATPETEPWVLDNLIDDIRPVSMRRDLIVLANFDARYRSSQTASADSTPHPEPIPQWQELLRRMDSENAMQGTPGGSTEPLIQP
ncbi:MAG: transglutaminase-like cysteine peptidase [Pseudomonadota bacterium]